MHELDRDRPVTDGRSDPLHRLRADVSGREDAVQAGLEGEWLAALLPRLRPGQLRPGQHEAVGVTRDGSAQPIGVRAGADEDVQAGRREVLPAAGAVDDLD